MKKKGGARQLGSVADGEGRGYNNPGVTRAPGTLPNYSTPVLEEFP
jgi:hypothetical protein